MFNVWNALRLAAVSLNPFMPDTTENIWKQLGLRSLPDETVQSLPEDENAYPAIYGWNWTPDYEIKVSKGEQLFPRIDTKKKKLKKEKKLEENKEQKKEEKSEDNLISINDFAKVQLKIGMVLEELSNIKAKRVLDIGCGVGRVTVPVAKQGAYVARTVSSLQIPAR